MRASSKVDTILRRSGGNKFGQVGRGMVVIRGY